MTFDHTDSARDDAAWRRQVWAALIVTASVLLSLHFACATPFAALAAVGALQLRPREALFFVGLAWLGNQAIGFGLLHYPMTWDCFAWGGAIGLAAFAAVGAAMLCASAGERVSLGTPIAALAAFAAYEGVLFAATAVLPSEGNAFALAIVARIFAVNAVAFVGLIVVHRLVVGAGLLPAGGHRRLATP